MKTVKETALYLNVSQVTVYNHIKKLDKKIDPYIFKRQGVTHITEQGIKEIKISMGLIDPPKVIKEYKSTDEIVNEISIKVNQGISDNIKSLSNEIKKDNQNLRERIQKDQEESSNRQKEEIGELQEQIKLLQSQADELKDIIEKTNSNTWIDKIKGLFKG